MTTALALSVVIPTHDRGPILTRCLDALFRQQSVPDGIEIVVVDDGSRDDTGARVEAARGGSTMPITYVVQPASGPAAARNRGVRHARGRLVLFLGDDILAEPTLLAEHARWHARFPEAMTAVLGFVTWSPSVAVTPYMRWLETSGNQFDYGGIGDREDIDPSRFLYTSNLSFKREIFFATGEWFDERFRHALLEDIDLGRRLAARGLHLKYNPSAIAYHEHAVSLGRYARRIELSSEYWVLLEKKRAEQPSSTTDVPANGGAPRSAAVARARRDYPSYAWFLARVCGEVIRNWPYWRLARFFERRRAVPEVFERAHRYWAHRGLLRVEARRALAKVTRAS